MTPLDTEFFGHAGNTIGYSSFLVCTTERGVCVAVLVNQTGVATENIVNALLERIFAFQETLTDVERQETVPVAFTLQQNYPNPFHLATTIHFALSKASPVTLAVYNLMGQQVTTLVSGAYPPGRYATTWDATGFARGVYVYRLQAGAYSETRTMLFLK